MLFIPQNGVDGRAITLSRAVSALRLENKGNGVGATLGLFSQLRPGTTIEICGEGFDERTVKVRANGMFYFVFSQDIASLKSSGKRTS